MQTVNFRCGHCNNLMAVGTEYLGQQVRCPTCLNVVVAPANVPSQAPVFAPEPVPAPTPAPPELENLFPQIAENEDIFSSGTQATDSLFDEPAHQLVELPASPLVTPESVPHPEPIPEPPLFLEPTPTPFQDQAATASFLPALEEFPPSDGTTLSDAVSAPWMSSSENGQTDSTQVGFAEPKKSREARPTKINWFIPLVFMPLLLYAVLATVAAAFLYLRLASAPPSIFDQMPDTQGDTPGTRPSKSTGQIFTIDQKMATRPLPEHLKVPLGSTLVVGDIEVTPTKLERGHFGIFTEGSADKPEPSPNESLKLHLTIKNRAKDYAFTPLDNFFDRKWSPSDGRATPLTLLQAGSTTFFGGPANWYSLSRDKKKGQKRDWLEGRKDVDHEGLGPGDTVETFVCTDGWNPAIQAHLFGLDSDGEQKHKPYAGNLLWRVQLRRGLIDYKGKKLPATAVIGVEFTSADLPTKAIQQDS